MSSFLQLALALAIIIVAAKLGGYASYRLGQPSVMGELLVGVILGPSLLDILHLPFFNDEHLAEVIHQFAELGVLLLMFLAGLEIHLSDLRQSTKVAVLAGTAGVILPLLLGAGLGAAFSFDFLPSLFIGLILAATSVSISAQTLMELNVLRSRVGVGLLGAAVFDDVLVVLGLSVFTALTSPDGGSGWFHVLVIILQIGAYLAVASAIGYFWLPGLSRRAHHLPISQGLMAFSFVTILFFGWLAEALGNMAAITGAFLAGLWLTRSPVHERIVSGASVLAYGVFVPVFFVNVGLTTNAAELFGPSFWLFLTMAGVAIVAKVLGAGLGASLGGFNRREALQLGVGMMSRGEVGLIVASVGIDQGLISQGVFAAVVGVVVATTLLTPPLLRSLVHRKAAGVIKRQPTVEGEEK
jgi:Kef-type K+ transport system membrane component KefB